MTGLSATQSPDPLERGMHKLKKMVYKNRLRMKEYFVDWDKLRHGYVHSGQFTSGLGIAGIDTFLTTEEIAALTEAYTVMRTPTLPMVDYRRFCNDVELVFTLPVSEGGGHAREGRGRCAARQHRALIVYILWHIFSIEILFAIALQHAQQYTRDVAKLAKAAIAVHLIPHAARCHHLFEHTLFYKHNQRNIATIRV